MILSRCVVGKLGDGGKALGEDFAVAAVAAVDVVIHAEQVGLPDGRGFLADRKVRRAAVVVFDALVAAAELDLVEHVLKRPDDLHVALDAQEVLLSEALGSEFLLAGLLVLVEGDRGELELAGAAMLDGADGLALGHGMCCYLFNWW